MSADPRVAAVIVSFDTRALTLEAVASVLSSEGVRPEVWVVDNGSSDGSAEAVARCHPDAHVLTPGENLGFGRANNLALEAVDAPYVLLLNSDAAFPDRRGLRHLVDVLSGDARVGIVGPRLESPGGELEYSVRAFPSMLAELARATGAHRWLSARTRERRLAYEFRDHTRGGSADWLTGACLLVRRELLERIGGFDPAVFLYGEEMDLCWRARRDGWDVVFAPGVSVVHHRGASGGGGGAGAWRARLAMAGDAYVIRKHRGVGYFSVFFCVRCLALGTEAVVQGLGGLAPRSGARRARAGAAVRRLGSWIAAVARGGATRPADLRWRSDTA